MKLQLWDTGGMERVASITSSYYKYSEAAILVFALDRPDTFHVLSQYLLDIVTYAENAKIFLWVVITFDISIFSNLYAFEYRCGNKFDLKSKIQVTDADMEGFCEQCRNLVSGVYKTSCKTGEGVEDMFRDIAKQLTSSNKYDMPIWKAFFVVANTFVLFLRSRMELKAMEESSFRVERGIEATERSECSSC